MAAKTALSTIKAKRGVALLLAVANASVLTVDGMGSAAAAVIFSTSPVQSAAKTDGPGANFNLDTLLDAYFTQRKSAGKSPRGPTAEPARFGESGEGDPLLTGGGAGLAGIALEDGLSWSPTLTLGSARGGGAGQGPEGAWQNGGPGAPGVTLSLAGVGPAGLRAIVLDAVPGGATVPGFAYEEVADQTGPATARPAAAVELPAVPLPAPGALLLGALALPFALRFGRRRRS